MPPRPSARRPATRPRKAPAGCALRLRGPGARLEAGRRPLPLHRPPRGPAAAALRDRPRSPRARHLPHDPRLRAPRRQAGAPLVVRPAARGRAVEELRLRAKGRALKRSFLEIAVAVLAHTPLWVWALFAFLL